MSERKLLKLMLKASLKNIELFTTSFLSNPSSMREFEQDNAKLTALVGLLTIILKRMNHKSTMMHLNDAN